MRDGTSEDSATQLLICEPLSFAILIRTVEPWNHQVDNRVTDLPTNQEMVTHLKMEIEPWNHQVDWCLPPSRLSPSARPCWDFFFKIIKLLFLSSFTDVYKVDTKFWVIYCFPPLGAFDSNAWKGVGPEDFLVSVYSRYYQYISCWPTY